MTATNRHYRRLRRHRKKAALAAVIDSGWITMSTQGRAVRQAFARGMVWLVPLRSTPARRRSISL
jgi:hypothetical protein